MKSIIIGLVLSLAFGCAERTTEATVTGLNGQSCQTSQNSNSTTITCGSQQVQINNVPPTLTGCTVQPVDGGALIVCGQTQVTVLNGTNGTNGSTFATITDYNTNSCVNIIGTSAYTKPTGNNNRGLYSTSNCASNSKFGEVSQGESYWVSGRDLATWYNGVLRVVTF
jgi:hypothetical protein